MTRPERITVVGASLAGLRAVEALREFGFDGALTLVGAEPHPPYDRPPLSKQVLAGTREPESLFYRKPEALAELGLDLRLGRRATALDLTRREVTLDDGARVGFDGLVIATGTTARVLPGTPPMDGVYTLRTLDDCIALRAEFERSPRVVVVGAGFIGAEVAATAHGRGLDVTVIEAAPVPMERALGEEMALACTLLHRDNGVDLRLGTGVAAIEGTSRVERVRLADGSAVDADVVVVGIGVKPETGWLEGSGLELRDGVVCDAMCQTSAPGVYAAGDIARWPNELFGGEMRIEHWSNAADQAHAAARNMLADPGESKPYTPVPYFWSDQYDATIQLLGHPDPGDEVRVVQGSIDERKFVALYRRGERLTGALGLSWPRMVMPFRSLLLRGASWDDAMVQVARQS